MDSLPGEKKKKLKVLFQANSLKLNFPLPSALKLSFPTHTIIACLFVCVLRKTLSEKCRKLYCNIFSFLKNKLFREKYFNSEGDILN